MSQSPKVIAVIPARYQSTRFEGKPLALIAGKPMIQRVYEQVKKCSDISDIIVATDDQRIQATAEAFGATVVMTSSDHESGTDRIAEAVKNFDCDIVVNVQGDEPLIEPETIEGVIRPFFNDKTVEMTTSSAVLQEKEEIIDPNCVKVVTDLNNFALYFSRSAIPFDRDDANPEGAWRLHLGIYGYRKETLLRYSRLSPTPLERLEKLEQLRALENGIKIFVAQTPYRSIGVDRPEDVQKVEGLL